MRALAVSWQRNIHPDRGDGRLRSAVAILETHRVAQPANAATIDRELARIGMRLDIGDRGYFGFVHVRLREFVRDLYASRLGCGLRHAEAGRHGRGGDRLRTEALDDRRRDAFGVEATLREQ